MKRPIRTSLYVLALLLPALALGLCAWSGGRVFSARERMVSVVTQHELWGDNMFTQAVPGPIFGWYVGFDVVGATVVAALVVVAGLWLWRPASAVRREAE